MSKKDWYNQCSLIPAVPQILNAIGWIVVIGVSSCCVWGTYEGRAPRPKPMSYDTPYSMEAGLKVLESLDERRSQAFGWEIKENVKSDARRKCNRARSYCMSKQPPRSSKKCYTIGRRPLYAKPRRQKTSFQREAIARRPPYCIWSQE